jgi:inner membrane protein
VPTPISHATVGFAIGAWTAPAPPSTRVCVAAAACAALPDIDFLWSLRLPETSPFAHRAITHSLLFAVVAALGVAVMVFSDERWRSDRRRITAVMLLALLSHSCLDALSTYSFGIGFFVPLTAHRFRFPWTPLGRPNGTIASQLVEEGLVLFLPAVAIAWLGWRSRSRRPIRAPSP